MLDLDEAMRPHLLEPLDVLLMRVADGHACLGGLDQAGGAAGKPRRDRVIAVDASDLLDQVFLDRQVEAARRWRHLPAFGVAGHFQSERAQYALHVGVRYPDPEHAGQARAAAPRAFR